LLPLAIDRLLVERGYKARLGPWSMATVQTRLAALSKAHEQYDASNAHLQMGPEKNPLRNPRDRSAAGQNGQRTAWEAIRPLLEIGICHRSREAVDFVRRDYGDDRAS
jgi:hypothetical protein